MSKGSLPLTSAARSFPTSKQVAPVSPVSMGKAEHSPMPIMPSEVWMRMKVFCATVETSVAMTKGSMGMASLKISVWVMVGFMEALR